FAVVIALIAAFVLVERRVKHPLLRLGILRNRNVLAANLSAMAVFGSYIGFQFIGALYLQSLLGWSPLQMALAFLPAGLIVASGLVQTAFQVGGAISLAVVTALISAPHAVAPVAVLDSFRPALYLVTALAVAGLALAAWLGKVHRREPVAA